MSRFTTILAIVAIILGSAAAALSAQSLLNNEFYRKAQDLKAQSAQAFQNGDYDQAAALADQAKEYFAKSDEYVATMTALYTARGWLFRANERIAYAKSIKADVNYRDAYNQAVSDAGGAKDALDAKEYDRSTELSKSALAVLENIAPASAQVLPRQYIVRLIPSRRDCFWRIAEYPFVYNNPWMWRKLYEANKSILTNPDNPDLIEPGQVFTIPDISSEQREGMYDPKKSYSPLK